MFYTPGPLGSLHCLQFRDQPVHISPFQLKLTKSAEDHQVNGNKPVRLTIRR